MKSILNLLAGYLNVSTERRKVFAVVELLPSDKEECGYTMKKRTFHKGALCNPVYSVSKSSSALVLGTLFDKGLVTPEDKVEKYLGKYFPSDIDPQWKDVTLNDVMHHLTGCDDSADLDFDRRVGHLPEELLDFVFSFKIKYTPGVHYRYDDMNYYIICRVIEEITGETAAAIAQREFFAPMGFLMNSWTGDNHNHTLGGTGLFLRIEDYAKLGIFYLNNGVWNGKRLVSAEWMERMFDTSATGKQNYGYGIRKSRDGVYTISGARGQCLYINMNNRRVVAWQAHRTSMLLTFCYFFDLIFQGKNKTKKD